MSHPIKHLGAIVIMGVSGSGKSTIGRRLSKELRCPFIEGDDLHDVNSIAKMKSGIPLDNEDRWPWLDRIGHAIQRAVAVNGIAVASCSALKESYRDRLNSAVSAPLLFVLLEVSKTELAARLQRRSDHFMPATLLDSQLKALERPTREERAIVVNAERDAGDICRTILDWLAHCED